MKSRMTCALFSNGWQSEPGYCYGLDRHLDSDKPCHDCEHWLGSLRTEPINLAPLLKPEELLARRVKEMDGGEDD